jgi:hypothetical protein
VNESGGNVSEFYLFACPLRAGAGDGLRRLPHRVSMLKSHETYVAVPIVDMLQHAAVLKLAAGLKHVAALLLKHVVFGQHCLLRGRIIHSKNSTESGSERSRLDVCWKHADLKNTGAGFEQHSTTTTQPQIKSRSPHQGKFNSFFSRN